MSKIYEIADGFVDTLAELDPIVATYLGVPGYDHLMPDYSPEASERSDAAERDVLNRIKTESPDSVRERRCSETVQEEMTRSIDQHAAGLQYSGMNILHSPVQSLRQIFDLMPRSSTADWENIASRMEGIADSIATYRDYARRGQGQRIDDVEDGKPQVASNRLKLGLAREVRIRFSKGSRNLLARRMK